MNLKIKELVEIIAIHAIISGRAGNSVYESDVTKAARVVANEWAKLNPTIAEKTC